MELNQQTIEKIAKRISNKKRIIDQTSAKFSEQGLNCYQNLASQLLELKHR